MKVSIRRDEMEDRMQEAEKKKTDAEKISYSILEPSRGGRLTSETDTYPHEV
jgi:hypothetical protein